MIQFINFDLKFSFYAENRSYLDKKSVALYLEHFFRDMFDLSHKLFKTKKQLEETLQLIAITEQTNEVICS